MVEIPLVLTGAVLTSRAVLTRAVLAGAATAMVVAGTSESSSPQLQLCNILLLYLEWGGCPI